MDAESWIGAPPFQWARNPKYSDNARAVRKCSSIVLKAGRLHVRSDYQDGERPICQFEKSLG